MNSRERLMATLCGEPVDRPAVSFYEIGGLSMDPDDTDPFNVHNDPSWRPLLELAEEKTDLIRMGMLHALPGTRTAASESFYEHREYTEGTSRLRHTTLRAGGRTMTQLTRRDAGVDTVWAVEHLLKDADDLRAFLDLPDEAFAQPQFDMEPLHRQEAELGDRGIVMIDAGDPLCAAAGLFDLSTYTLVAATEPELFHRLLQRFAGPLLERTHGIAAGFPGHLWRICGPEYATEPYLPPALFEEYVVRYTGPMVQAIKDHGGFPRVHCHGRIRSALPHILAMGADATDPIEPPPQGDVELADVRREYGRDLVLFGNIEVSAIESMEPARFRNLAEQAVRDGTAGEGRGFVLMPSSCPYGRHISATTMANYETLVEAVEKA